MRILVRTDYAPMSGLLQEILMDLGFSFVIWTGKIEDIETTDRLLLDGKLANESSVNLVAEIRQTGFAGKIVVFSYLDKPEKYIQAGADHVCDGMLHEEIPEILGTAA